jgi:dipeptidase E
MNLVLYSGGAPRDNRVLAQEVSKLLAQAEEPLLSFIPSDERDMEEDFEDFKAQFPQGRFRFRLVPIHRPMSPKRMKELLASDAIFLGGGNTFYFLQTLRARGLLPRLKNYVKRGGLLMGLSAGSILMTPSIKTASVPSLDADDNYVGLTNLKALGLVPFEFSPHYVPTREVDAELRAYSALLDHPIYAAKDGGGIVVKNGRIRRVGDVAVFRKGRKVRLQ